MSDSELRGEPIFEERQRFRQLWRWGVILVSVIGSGVGIYFGARTPADLIALSIAGIVLPLLFFFIQLRTEVYPDRVRLRFFPFHLRFREWRYEEIESAQARTYSPLREYGGWGIRFGASGWAYNISGKEGVQLVFRSGKRILIGSREAERLAEAIRWASDRATGRGAPRDSSRSHPE